MRRTQIYLDEDQADRLDDRAAARGVTRSQVIREAVESYIAGVDDDHDARLARFRAAVDEAFGCAPHLPPGEAYVDEMRGAGAR